MASGSNRTLNLSVVTPSKLLYEGQVSATQIPLHDGLIGVLPGHAPLIGLLGFGPLTLTDSLGRRMFAIDGGFVEITPERVTVLANSGEALEDLDVSAVQQEFDDAMAAHAQGDAAVQERLDRIAAARTRLKYGTQQKS